MSENIWKAAGLGIVAGMRSMSAPALVSDYCRRTQPLELAGSGFRWLGEPEVAGILGTLAVGEMVGDKLPNTPSRLDPGPLLGRAALGAGAGAAVCAAGGERPAAGALTGGLAAVASAYVFFHLRRSLGRTLHLPDPLLGLAEDALAITVGKQVLTIGGEDA